MKELANSIIQTVKDELQITDELSAAELYNILYDYRNSQHPDKFIADERKKEAEEKFKRLHTLLQELANFIEKQKQQSKPSEIIPFQKDYEIVKSKQQSINNEEIIKNLQQINNANEREIKRLKKVILELQGNKADEKTNNLIKHYKPSKKSILSQGIIFLLTLIIGTLTKVEEIASILKKYFPFDTSNINYITFSILVFIPLKILKSYLEERQIEKFANLVRTQIFIKKFLNYLIINNSKNTFTEINVFDFLTSELAPKNAIMKLIKRIFNTYNDTTIDSLKDIFIFNLLNKQLITISNAEHLDRNFKIVSKYNFPSIDFDLGDLDL